MSRGLRALHFASSRRSLTHTLGHSQWPRPPRFVYTQPHQPGSGRRVTVLARSDHSSATEEPAPSVTLPPTSVPVIVWCGDTPVVLRSLDDRCERHKRANRAWSARWPASLKGRIESEPRGPSQLQGMRGVARIAPSQLRTVTIRHGSNVFVLIFPCFGYFGQPFPSQDGPSKKSPTWNLA